VARSRAHGGVIALSLLEQSTSPYAVLGAMVSGGGGLPYLWFDGRGETTT
jgi:hypothetical protein